MLSAERWSFQREAGEEQFQWEQSRIRGEEVDTKGTFSNKLNREKAEKDKARSRRAAVWRAFRVVYVCVFLR